MIIYKATNKVNHKCYIGITSRSLEKRMVEHKYGSTTPKSYFHKAIHKYGMDNFEWLIIDECDTRDELNDMEVYYIKQYHSRSFDWGYNLTEGGDGGHGHKPTEETLQKLRKCHGGKNNGMYGKPHTKESKLLMSVNRKGKTSGKNNPMYGKKGKDNPNYGRKQPQEEINKRTKTYKIIFPDGSIRTIQNMNKFCIEYNLTSSCMINVSAGRSKSHKGFKCIKIQK